MKKCTLCKENKSLDQFSKSRKAKSSLDFRANNSIVYSSICKPCRALKAKQWRKEYKEKTGISDYRGTGKLNKFSKEDRLLRSAIVTRLAQAKSNSKRNPERDFNIDIEYMFELYKTQKGLCALSNIPMVIKMKEIHTLSIDKIIPNLGYIKGNVQWVSLAANRAKSDLTMKDFLHLCNEIIMFNKV